MFTRSHVDRLLGGPFNIVFVTSADALRTLARAACLEEECDGVLNRAQPGSRLPVPRLLWWCGLLALVGAVLLITALARPNRGVLGLTTSPRSVLVALAPPAGQPGFAGFVVVIQGNGSTWTVVPVPGTVAGAPKDPLWLTASNLTPAVLAHDVGRDAHIRLSGYLVVQEPAVAQLLQTLATTVHSWPASLPPDVALERLGWPTGGPVHYGQAALIQTLLTDLPQLPPHDVAAAQQVEAGAKTNLSLEQLFLLGTYIRSDSLKVVAWKHVRSIAQ